MSNRLKGTGLVLLSGIFGFLLIPPPHKAHAGTVAGSAIQYVGFDLTGAVVLLFMIGVVWSQLRQLRQARESAIKDREHIAAKAVKAMK